MTAQNRKAAVRAAHWWGERLNPDIGRREEFEAALTNKVEAALDASGRCRLTCDYDPWDILLDALREAGIECAGYMFSAREILPEKHTLTVTPSTLSPKEGYGNWTEDILIPRG